jgi:hypothetical protein
MTEKTTGLRGELVTDSKDIYNRGLKWFILIFMGWYIVRSLITQHEDEADNGIFTSTARDSGLKMHMKQFPPESLLNLHAISGFLLCIFVLVQKHTIILMLEKSYKKYAYLHKYLGYTILTLISAMVYGGYALGAYSAFASFDIFSFFFALPFVLWIVGIYYTARASMITFHRLLGNMLLKGCVAVPMSRIGGAFLQGLKGWDAVSGFYQGIGGVALIILIWQTYETYEWWKHYRQQHVKVN